MPLVMTQIEEAPRDTRMTLVDTQFLGEYGGRLKAGTVVLVDAGTARKWEAKGIAVPSAITDKTLKEQKLAELQRIQDEVAALDAPPELTGPLYRALAPSDREQMAARLAPRAPRAKVKRVTVPRRPKAQPAPAPTADAEG